MKTREIKTWDELNSTYDELKAMTMDKNILLARLAGEFKSLSPKSKNLNFDNIERIHDWRNYIPDEIREVWNDLSTEAKLTCAFMAQTQVDNEEWE